MSEHEISFRGQSFRVAECSAHGESQSSIYTFEVESHIRERYLSPAAGERVVDVGAGFGSYTMTALALGANVIAFEPDPEPIPCLRANLALNPGFAERCLISQLALSDHAGVVEDPPPGHPARAGATQPPARFSATTLDRWFQMNKVALATVAAERVDLMKIDTEGHEVAVLRGAEETIRTYRPRILCEAHSFLDRPELGDGNRQLQLIVNELERQGYQHCEIFRDNPIDYVWAVS